MVIHSSGEVAIMQYYATKEYNYYTRQIHNLSQGKHRVCVLQLYLLLEVYCKTLLFVTQ